MKKTVLVMTLAIALCQYSFAQFGAKIIHVRPTGELGMAMKTTFSGELIYKSFDDDSDLQGRISLGFIKMSPRMDVFPVQGVISGQGTTVVPGTMTFSKYNVMYLAAGVDYHFELAETFFLYAGADVNFGGVNQDYQAYYPTISDEGYSGGSVYIGIRPRLGAEYRTDNFGIFFEANRNMNLIPTEAFMNYNDYGIGFRLYID